jgi:hypothetical protein
VEYALVIACSMAHSMHSWSYYGLAILVPCHVGGALLPLDEMTMYSTPHLVSPVPKSLQLLPWRLFSSSRSPIAFRACG